MRLLYSWQSLDVQAKWDVALMKIIITGSLIFLFWFLLSGHTGSLLISLGIASTVLTVFLSRRMNIIDHESWPFHLSLRLLRYYLYLAKEIVMANISVIKNILRPSSIQPVVFTLPAGKQTKLSKVIYANSITLTPGTVALDMNDDEIKVHALDASAADDLMSGDMARAVPDNEEITP